jgi:hypothetical protein
MHISTIPPAFELINLQDGYLTDSSWPSEGLLKFKGSNSLIELIEANHFFNTQLWNEEDLARRQKVSDSEIAKNKRAIDRFNQSRNDFIEQIDYFILQNSQQIEPKNSKQNSETLGAIIDRLSILSLKIFHMTTQVNRQNVSITHTQNCSDKLEILKIQRNDLGICFDELAEDFKKGLRYFKQYKQFKMYNDPNLNPQIYNEK